MFDPRSAARLFGLAPGIDFPRELVRGLRARLAGQPPDAMARVELIVNTARMRRRIERVFAEGPPGLMPRIRLLDDPGPVLDAALPPPVPPLRRRLELTGLVSRLLDIEPDLAPRSALFDLADGLAGLMDEMQIEGVDPARVAALDVTDQSGHWARALRFFQIVQQFFDEDSAPDAAARQRRLLDLRLAAWAAAPPEHPVILAGSTGSRGTTLRLMIAIAQMPQGAVVLPGFDTDMPRHVWDQLIETMPGRDTSQPGEDHPQFRFARLLQSLDASPQDVAPWTDATPPSPERNRLVSLALRPAPVTDQWLSEGPNLVGLDAATEAMTLVEATTRREEALAIALRLREAAETGQSAALVTPDRMLSRQVTAALDRWGVLPDDSAGVPAQLTPPGRLLRHVAALETGPLTAESLLTILKHPLAHAGDREVRHGLMTQSLELWVRKTACPYPDAEALRRWASTDRTPEGAADWAEWAIACFCQPPSASREALADRVARHRARTEAIVAGTAGTDFGPLWDKQAGHAVRELFEELASEAGHGADLSARDYAALFGAILSRIEVRDRDAPHPNIKIWGTIEARAMGADLLILGSLNDGAWPEIPAADPWLNRKMRADAGLLLPERRIGLSAHDFQQAIAGREVWLTRAQKSDDAETVPSRWLNRLGNLLSGLPERQGPEALAGMRERGRHWLGLARALDAPIRSRPAHRPSPVPPVEMRPRKLSVTQVKTLIRDPYAIYARHVLRLRPLDPLQRAPDALLRGITVHKVAEVFIRRALADPAALTPDTMMRIARDLFAELPFPTIRQLWTAKLARVAEGFVADEAVRQQRATVHPERLEIKGSVILPDTGFTLTGTADRIDIDARGGGLIYDYKTGTPPTSDTERHFDKQLLLEAGMLVRGGFDPLKPSHVAHLAYIGLGSKPGEAPIDLEAAPPEQVWAEFETLVARMLDEGHGFTSRRAMQQDRHGGDYDHLARLGEWDVTDPAVKDHLT